MDQRNSPGWETPEAPRLGGRPRAVPRLPRTAVAVAAAVAVAVACGGPLALSTAAHAAPGDPVVFADRALADAVNVELGQQPGDVTTEAQAASITDLTARDALITNLAGIEQLTGLERLDLDYNRIADLTPLTGLPGLVELSLYENGLTDISPLSAMTSLEYLYLDYNAVTDLSALPRMTGLTELSLTSNGIADISELSGMTGLTDLYLDGNAISDLSALSGLTGLRGLVLYDNEIADLSPLSHLGDLEGLFLSGNSVSDLSPLAAMSGLRGLHLEENRVSDVSPLASLTGLQALGLAKNRISDISPLAGLIQLGHASLSGQDVQLPGVGVGAPTANPVVGVGGEAVTVSSADPGFTYDGLAHSWAFADTGAKALSWSAPVTLGEVTALNFAGTLSQTVSTGTPLVALQHPTVVQAACVAGRALAPQITLAVTDGITYGIDGDIEAGATVKITATAGEGRTLVAPSGSGWVTDSDGVAGALSVMLDERSCGAAVAVAANGVPPAAANPSALAQTGAGQSAATLGGLAALITLAGVVLVAARARNRTRASE